MFFLELSCFFDNPTDVGNLISGSSVFSKPSLNFWKFTFHVLLNPGLENLEHYFASVWVSIVKSLSRVRLFATPWTVAYQASPSMGFSRQEYWSGLPFPSPGDLPDPGIKPGFPALEADALTSEPPGKTVERIFPQLLLSKVLFSFWNKQPQWFASTAV